MGLTNASYFHFHLFKLLRFHTLFFITLVCERLLNRRLLITLAIKFLCDATDKGNLKFDPSWCMLISGAPRRQQKQMQSYPGRLPIQVPCYFVASEAYNIFYDPNAKPPTSQNKTSHVATRVLTTFHPEKRKEKDQYPKQMVISHQS